MSRPPEYIPTQKQIQKAAAEIRAKRKKQYKKYSREAAIRNYVPIKTYLNEIFFELQ